MNGSAAQRRSEGMPRRWRATKWPKAVSIQAAPSPSASISRMYRSSLYEVDVRSFGAWSGCSDDGPTSAAGSVMIPSAFGLSPQKAA